MVIVGMGGTLLVLVLMSGIITLLKKCFPVKEWEGQEQEKEGSHG